jgi:hypothetical protein
MNEYHNLAPLTKTGRRFVLTAASIFIALIIFATCSRLLEIISTSGQ